MQCKVVYSKTVECQNKQWDEWIKLKIQNEIQKCKVKYRGCIKQQMCIQEKRKHLNVIQPQSICYYMLIALYNKVE